MSKSHENELNSLVVPSLLETHTPLQMGSLMISDLTSSNTINITNLSTVFKAVDNAEPAQKLNAGKLLSNVINQMIEKSNRLYTIKIVNHLHNSNLFLIYR